MKNALLIITFFLLISACSERKAQIKSDFVLADGQMPAVTKDNANNLHIVFGIGDSIMYTYSSDDAITFSEPVLIAHIPDVYTFAMRGPQIAATDNCLVVTACTSDGNIYSFYKNRQNN